MRGVITEEGSSTRGASLYILSGRGKQGTKVELYKIDCKLTASDRQEAQISSRERKTFKMIPSWLVA